MRTFRYEFPLVDYALSRSDRSSAALELPAPQTLLSGFLEGRDDDVNGVR